MTDWIMIAITMVYVAATIVICYYNAQSANAAKKQTTELIREYQENNRPYISIRYDIIRGGLMCFIIENVGAQPAFSLNIKLNDLFLNNIADQKRREHLAKLSQSEMYLASKQQVFALIDTQVNFEKIASEKAILHITYNGKYSEKIEIDISQYSWMLIYTSPIEDISQHIKQIKEEQKRFQKALLSNLSSESKN